MLYHASWKYIDEVSLECAKRVMVEKITIIMI